MTATNVATLSAKYAVLSAVWKAVEEIQMLRAGVLDGLPGLRVLGGGRLVRDRLAGGVEEATHLRVGLATRAASVCLRMTAANAFASLPVSTFWPGIVESGVPTICSRARSLRTVLRPSMPM